MIHCTAFMCLGISTVFYLLLSYMLQPALAVLIAYLTVPEEDLERTPTEVERERLWNRAWVASFVLFGLAEYFTSAVTLWLLS